MVVPEFQQVTSPKPWRQLSHLLPWLSYRVCSVTALALDSDQRHLLR